MIRSFLVIASPCRQTHKGVAIHVLKPLALQNLCDWCHKLWITTAMCSLRYAPRNDSRVNVRMSCNDSLIAITFDKSFVFADV